MDHQTQAETLKSVLQIVAPTATAAVVTWINIQVRFAKDAEQAMSEAKDIVRRVAVWICNFILLWNLVREPIDPLRDLSLPVLAILLKFYALSYAFISWQVRNLVVLMRVQTEQGTKLLAGMQQALDIARRYDTD